MTGPFFVEGIVTGKSYPELLESRVMSETGHHQDLGNVIRQQDVAAHNFGRNVRAFLNQKFPMWIGRHVSGPPDLLILYFVI